MDHDSIAESGSGESGCPRLRQGPGRLAVMIGLAIIFAILCGLPYLKWLEHPSLYHDDFMRAESLRNSTLREALFRPFNEHMAPLFETVSYLSWVATGRDVRRLPLTFMVASFIAFGATVVSLGGLIRRETGSMAAALAAIALFMLSSVSAETILWYSASSFQWAAAATLAAWFFAASAADSSSSRSRKKWLAGSAVACMAAPAFSAIGILAAPLAGLRLLSDRGRWAFSFRGLFRAAIPFSGLAIYLLICAGFRYGEVLTDSLDRNLDLGAALWTTARAPAWALFPALLGLRDQSLIMPGAVAALATGVVLIGSLFWPVASRFRSLILGGVALIVGGYFLIYAARAHPGDFWIIKITRYHLFPQIGLVCVIAGLLGRRLGKLDALPTRGFLVVTLLAALLASLQYRGMQLAGVGRYRFPDQPRLLSAAARLEEISRRESFSFMQCYRALDPVQPRWAPHPWPFHPILFLFGRGPSEGRPIPDPIVRNTLIAALSPEEREVIFGGMEATRYRIPRPVPAVGEPSTTARLVALSRIKSIGQGRFESLEGPAYLEFQLDPSADEARSLCLPGLKADWPVEVWWAGPSERWSPDRSVRWNPDAGPTSVDWAVPIDAFPHWRRGSPRRLRIVSGGSGTIVLGEPRFLR